MKLKRRLIYGGMCLMWMLCAGGCGQKAPGEPPEAALAETDRTAGAESGQSQKEGTSEETGQTPKQGAAKESGTGKEEAEKAKDAGSEAVARTDRGADTGEKSGGERIDREAGGQPKALAVSGTQLVNQDGNPVQLKGISTHGLAWYPEYVNEDCFRQLKEEWGADIVRLAMYTAEYGGYCTGGNQEDLKALVRDGVEYATDCGLYVIIDWHILSDGNPNAYLEEAKEFFREMSEEYADYENVIYEICNEPNGGVSWAEIKSYAEQVIAVIREQDADGIILVGTPNWSQYVDQAAADPITGYENIMYTLHFYAATHRDSLRDTMGKAVDAGLPVFVSEYGICDASGNGGIDRGQADKWVEVMDAYGISYVAWNLSNKAETSAILKSSCTRTSGFTTEDLSDSGKWLLEMLGGPGEGKAGGPDGSPANGSPSGGAGDSCQNADAGKSQDNGPGAGTPQDSTGSTGTGKESAQTPPGEPVDSAAGQGSPEAGDLTAKAEIINSWEQNNESYYQYEVTLTNPAETPQEGWKITLTFEGDIALQNGWNGNYQAEGNTLTITNMDYNARLDAGGSVGNIGFILKIAP